MGRQAWDHAQDSQRVEHRVARTTIANILNEHGIEPAPTQSKHINWAEFLSMHRGVIAAMDFSTVEVGSRNGLTRLHVFYVIDLATRHVEIAGISNQPYGEWECNALRQQLDDFDVFLRNHKYLILDRDAIFTQAMNDMLGDFGVESIKLSLGSSNLNAYAERFVCSMKCECLDRIIPIGKRHLRNTIDTYIDHYNRDRPRQGLNNELLTMRSSPGVADGEIVCDVKLGGLIRSYRRAA